MLGPAGLHVASATSRSVLYRSSCGTPLTEGFGLLRDKRDVALTRMVESQKVLGLSRLRRKGPSVQSRRSTAGGGPTDGDPLWRPLRDGEPSDSSTWAHTTKAAELDAYFVRQTVAPGQTINHSGTVVVFGDVQVGATVKAGKDIIVWGRLLGDAHAGMQADKMDRTAVICCLHACPISVRIGDVSLFDAQQRRECMTGSEYSGPIMMHIGRNGEICAVRTEDQTAEDPRVQATQFPFHCDAMEHSTVCPCRKASPPVSASIVTGAYISLVGLSLMFAPLTVFSLLFDASKIAAGWIRVFGVLCVAFGTYYLGTALGDAYGQNNSFYISTVVGRVFIAISLSAIVASRELPPALLILAAVNLFGALSMLAALAKGRKA